MLPARTSFFFYLFVTFIYIIQRCAPVEPQYLTFAVENCREENSYYKMISEILCLLTTGFLPQTTRNLGSGSKSVWWSPIPSSPPRQDYVIYQGDILLPTNENLRNAIKVKKHLWKNGIVPYEFRDNFSKLFLLPY